MNLIWQRNFDDDVLVVAVNGSQVASIARHDGKSVPGAMTEIGFSTDVGMLQAILDRTHTVTEVKGEVETKVSRFIRAYGWSARDENGGRRFANHGGFVRIGEDESAVADRVMAELADILRSQ